MKKKKEHFFTVYSSDLKLFKSAGYLLSLIRHWCEVNKSDKKKVSTHFHHEHWWMYDTAKDLGDKLGVNESTIKEYKKKLLGKKVIKVGNFNIRGYDKTCWYRVDEVVLNQLIERSILDDEKAEKTTEEGEKNTTAKVENQPVDGLDSDLPIPILNSSLTNQLETSVENQSNEQIVESKIDKKTSMKMLSKILPPGWDEYLFKNGGRATFNHYGDYFDHLSQKELNCYLEYMERILE